MSEGRTEKFIELMNLPHLDNYQIWNDMIQTVLPNIKAAEQWIYVNHKITGMNRGRSS